MKPAVVPPTSSAEAVADDEILAQEASIASTTRTVALVDKLLGRLSALAAQPAAATPAAELAERATPAISAKTPPTPAPGGSAALSAPTARAPAAAGLAPRDPTAAGRRQPGADSVRIPLCFFYFSI